MVVIRELLDSSKGKKDNIKLLESLLCSCITDQVFHQQLMVEPRTNPFFSSLVIRGYRFKHERMRLLVGTRKGRVRPDRGGEARTMECQLPPTRRRLIQEGFRRQSRIARTRTTFVSTGNKSRRESVYSDCGDIQTLWVEHRRERLINRYPRKLTQENSCQDRGCVVHKIENRREIVARSGRISILTKFDGGYQLSLFPNR